jgi:hypothetical protein
LRSTKTEKSKEFVLRAKRHEHRPPSFFHCLRNAVRARVGALFNLFPVVDAIALLHHTADKRFIK